MRISILKFFTSWYAHMNPQLQASQHIITCSKAVMFACLRLVSIFHQMLASAGSADHAFSHSPINAGDHGA